MRQTPVHGVQNHHITLTAGLDIYTNTYEIRFTPKIRRTGMSNLRHNDAPKTIYSMNEGVVKGTTHSSSGRGVPRLLSVVCFHVGKHRIESLVEK